MKSPFHTPLQDLAHGGARWQKHARSLPRVAAAICPPWTLAQCVHAGCMLGSQHRGSPHQYIMLSDPSSATTPCTQGTSR